MQFLIDTHVHIYPFYSISRALQAMLTNTKGQWVSTAIRIACMTERYDCDVFNQIKDGQVDGLDRIFNIESEEKNILRIISKTSNESFYLIPGQQIVTKENIEILALNTALRVSDGLPAKEVIPRILDKEGIPVLAWGLGKWLFKRRSVVETLLTTYTPKELTVGDTSLRPIGWGTPTIMRQASKQGFHILSGSDPLPFSGEENRVGSYVSTISTGQNSYTAGEVLPQLLSNPSIVTGSAGHRCSPIGVAKRIYKSKRAA